MSGFAPDSWRAVSPYLDQALTMPEEERAAWLAALRQENPQLAADLQTLLDEHRMLERDRFLEGHVPLPALTPLAGQLVGAYRLLSPIGQGEWARCGLLNAATAASSAA
jgi:hypothetical protein